MRSLLAILVYLLSWVSALPSSRSTLVAVTSSTPSSSTISIVHSSSTSLLPTTQPSLSPEMLSMLHMFLQAGGVQSPTHTTTATVTSTLTSLSSSLVSPTATTTTTTNVASPTATCFHLVKSDFCGVYEGVSIMATKDYKTVSEFDVFIGSQVANNSVYIQSFQTTFGCSKYSGQGLRYRTSVLCAKAVDEGRSACSSVLPSLPSKKLKSTPDQFGFDDLIKSERRICSDVCESAAMSLESLFRNSTICEQGPSSSIRQARKKYLMDALAVCNGSFGTGIGFDAQDCAGPLSSEESTCGFMSLSEAQAFCKSNDDSPCCGLVPAAPTISKNATTTPLSTTTESLAKKTNVPQAQAQTAGEVSSGNQVPTGGIVLGIFFGLVVIASGIFIYKSDDPVNDFKKIARKLKYKCMDGWTWFKNRFSRRKQDLKGNQVQPMDQPKEPEPEPEPEATIYIPTDDVQVDMTHASVPLESPLPLPEPLPEPVMIQEPKVQPMNIVYSHQSLPIQVHHMSMHPVETLVESNEKQPDDTNAITESTLDDQDVAQDQDSLFDDSTLGSRVIVQDKQGDEVNKGLALPFEVVERYEPILEDELRLCQGDIVIVTELFEDGEWAAGLNKNTGKRGMFPLANLVPTIIEEDDSDEE